MSPVFQNLRNSQKKQGIGVLLTIEPTKVKAVIKMDEKKRDQDVMAFLPLRPCRSAKKRVVYYTKSDSETESDEDSDKAPKKRSIKKKTNAIDSDINEFKLGPNADDEDESIAADTLPKSVSEEEEAPGWSILASTILEKESEDAEKDL